jgi:Rod binding domain-containing protein
VSSILPTDSTSVSPIDEALIPASVRSAGPKAEQLYGTAVEFEQVLLEQLTSQLSQSTSLDGSDGSDGSDDGSDGSDDGTASMMTQMLPGALAQGLSSAGGIGIAQELYTSLAAQSGIQTTPAVTPAQQSAADDYSDASSGGVA